MEDLVPFQVQLERRQHRRLRTLADREQRSMGALIRESVEAYLGSQDTADDPALDLIGLFEDEAEKAHGDVAANHDAYLADQYGSDRD